MLHHRYLPLTLDSSNTFFCSAYVILWRLNIDVFACLNFHLPRWSMLCCDPCLTDVHWKSSTINRCSTRYNSFFCLAAENLFCEDSSIFSRQSNSIYILPCKTVKHNVVFCQKPFFIYMPLPSCISVLA